MAEARPVIRAPGIPGLGIHYDYGLADFDIRNVFHLSGGYELPFGKGKRYLPMAGSQAKSLGGWTINTSAVLQGGQPITLTCPTNTVRPQLARIATTQLVTGQSPKRGLHIDANGKLSFFGNPAAFCQPTPMHGIAVSSLLPWVALPTRLRVPRLSEWTSLCSRRSS